jgi:hypothetical protein
MDACFSGSSIVKFKLMSKNIKSKVSRGWRRFSGTSTVRGIRRFPEAQPPGTLQ